MKPNELFGVLVRVIGFLVITYGLWNVWGGFEAIAEGILPLSDGNGLDLPSIFYCFAFGIPELIWGAICLFLADWIVRLAYRKDRS